MDVRLPTAFANSSGVNPGAFLASAAELPKSMPTGR